MLNEKMQRELCYVVAVDNVVDIEGVNNQVAVVNGWTIFVRRGEFHPGDLAIYFEIDSKVPATEQFAFLEKYKYAVKTRRFVKGKVISNGLLMHPSDFGWIDCCDDEGEKCIYNEKDNETYKLGDFLTEKLGVTYYEPEDNTRKNDMRDVLQKKLDKKYEKWFERHPIWSKFPFVKQIKYALLRKKIFPRKTKKALSATAFPTKFPFVKKTDEERVENMPWVLQDKRPLIATEKLDGTSSTYILERRGKNKFEFYVLSRNVRQLSLEQDCFHEKNIYWDMAIKYDIEAHLKQYLIDNPKLTYVCIQGESVGNVQGNPLKLKEDDFYCFNFIRSDIGKISSLDGKAIIESWRMKWVPILSVAWVNPDTMEEMKELATGKSVVNPEVLREGIVYRDPLDSRFSFKNVSNEFLLSKK